MIKNIIIIVINALCLAAFIVCLSLSVSIKTPLRSQQAATAWAGQSGERFAQLSVFFPESSGFNEEGIFGFRRSLDLNLLTASLESTTDRKLYTDAWSAETEVSLLSERGSATVKAIAVGGDFFLFHPLHLRDGNYLSPDDVMKDRILLDEELAWRLFGATQIAGFDVLINNKPFMIAGVIARENDFASTKAYTASLISRESDIGSSITSTSGAGLFMSYDALKDMTEDETSISTYEIVLPDPITGFALKTLKDSMSEPGIHIVENSARFSFDNSFALIGSFGERSMRLEAIAYPYWENAARYVEEYLALLLVFALLFILFPVVCAVVYSIIIIRFLIRRGKLTVTRFINKKDKRKYDKYLQEHGEEPQIYSADEIIREFREEVYEESG